MAGHSKWANIQHRKKAVDAKRGKVFTRVNRELSVAARVGGSDPDANERTIKKAAGELEGVTYEEIRYEGYAQNGVAVMVDTLTDNRNRTVAEVRHAFSKAGGNLGTDGSVAYLFDKIGVLNFEPGTSEDEVMEVALEAGADDIVTEQDGSIEVLTSPEAFADVVSAMEEAGLTPANAEITMRASMEMDLDVETGQKVLRFLDVLEDLDDTQAVYSNANIPEESYEG